MLLAARHGAGKRLLSLPWQFPAKASQAGALTDQTPPSVTAKFQPWQTKIAPNVLTAWKSPQKMGRSASLRRLSSRSDQWPAPALGGPQSNVIICEVLLDFTSPLQKRLYRSLHADEKGNQTDRAGITPLAFHIKTMGSSHRHLPQALTDTGALMKNRCRLLTRSSADGSKVDVISHSPMNQGAFTTIFFFKFTFFPSCITVRARHKSYSLLDNLCGR